jgi:hypothetical protein
MWRAGFLEPRDSDAVGKRAGEIPYYDPGPAKAAILLLRSMASRLSERLTDEGAEPINIPPPPRLPRTKREEYFRKRMEKKKLRTLQDVAKKAHVDVATVSRCMRHRAPAKRALSDGRIKVYRVLGIDDESYFPQK